MHKRVKELRACLAGAEQQGKRWQKLLDSVQDGLKHLGDYENYLAVLNDEAAFIQSVLECAVASSQGSSSEADNSKASQPQDEPTAPTSSSTGN